jgi:TonB family protein
MRDGSRDGDYETLYPNGVLQTRGVREKGRSVGREENFYAGGNPRSVLEYGEDSFEGAMLQYWDSNGKQLIKNGSGFCSCVFDEISPDSLVQTGRLINSKRDSTWIGTQDTRRRFIEEWDNGNLVKGKSFGEDGEVYEYTIAREMAVPSGGLSDLYRFIGDNLKYPMNARRRGIQGTVLVSFIIKKDGSISNVEIIKGISEECDAEALRVIRILRKWVPAVERGKKVKSKYVLPIKFKLGS